MAAAHRVEPDRWWAAYGAVVDLIAPRFKCYGPVRHAGRLMLGMVSSLARKNCWTIGEYCGDVTPDGLEHLLAGASWDWQAAGDKLADTEARMTGVLGEFKLTAPRTCIPGVSAVGAAVILAETGDPNRFAWRPGGITASTADEAEGMEGWSWSLR